MFQDYKVAYLRRHVRVKERLPFSFLRQSVAYTLSHSARNIPHAAGISQLDVTPLLEYGRTEEEKCKGLDSLDEKALFKRTLTRNYSAFFLKALGHVLSKVPALNGFLAYSPLCGSGTFYKAEDVNLSFTVHTKFGVIKPIIRNPHLKTLDEVAREMRDLARKARRTDPDVLYRRAAYAYMGVAFRELDFRALPGLWIYLRSCLFGPKPDPELAKVPEDQRLQVEDILGSTCTLANIGMMITAHQTVTVIIPPEVTMFGIGDLHQTPLVVNGEVVPRWVITVCFTFDHRAFDAGEGFPMYGIMKRCIDNPALIYNWKPGDVI